MIFRNHPGKRQSVLRNYLLLKRVGDYTESLEQRLRRKKGRHHKTVSAGSNLVAIILDHRIAQEVLAELIKLLAEFGGIFPLHLETDGFTHPDIAREFKIKMLHRMADRSSLRIQYILFR